MVNDKRLRIFLISIVTVHLWACAGFVDGSTDGSSREETRIDLLHSIAPPELSAKQRAELLLDAMTLREKIEFISGYEFFSVRPLPKLGLRSVLMSDATMGVRGHGRSTAFPAALAMAATWNTKLLHGVGRAIGEECRAKGIDVLLGPGINMYRIPNGGRNFEYFGEDPFLTSRAAVSYIEGVQDTGVVATVKHYIANNSDFDRDRMSSEVTERALDTMAQNNQVGFISFGATLGIQISVAPLSAIRFDIADAVTRMKAKGGTALYDGIKRGIEMTDAATGDANAIRGVVVLTDGQANQGNVRIDELINMMSNDEKSSESRNSSHTTMEPSSWLPW